jgi:hypothetical protein
MLSGSSSPVLIKTQRALHKMNRLRKVTIMAAKRKSTARSSKKRTPPPAPPHADPDDIDPQVYIDAEIHQWHEKIPALLRERLSAAGFDKVSVVYGAEPGFYEAVMDHGRNQQCRTTAEATAFLTALMAQMKDGFAECGVGVVVKQKGIRAAFILPW